MIKCSEVDSFSRLSYQYHQDESAHQVICNPNDVCHRSPKRRSCCFTSLYDLTSSIEHVFTTCKAFINSTVNMEVFINN